MQRPGPDLIVHGVVGGIIAGAVVTAWFLGVDLAAGEPFHTPARLAGIVLGEEFQGPWPRLIAVFTILHFGIFISLGVISVWFLSTIDVDPGLTVGAVFGLGVLNAVHYAGLMVTGTNLLTVVPVAHVLAANLAGGMLMMVYLHRAQGAKSPLGWGVLKQHPLLYDGLITGLWGGGAVALWFLLVDMVGNAPLHTPAALGSAILLGATGPLEVQLNPGIIGTYSFLHIVAFVLLGVAFVWLANRTARAPAFWLQAVTMLVLMESLFFGTVVITSGWVLEEIGWWAILIANGLAVATMGARIWSRHPKVSPVFLEDAAPSTA
jgi:hypothetical protein